MSALLRPFLAVFAVVFSAAFFGPAHRLLPAKTRLTSFGFVSVLIVFLAAGLVRHWAVAETADFTHALLATVVWLVLLIFFLGSRGSGYRALVLAVSAGVDLTVSLLGIAGMDIGDGMTRTVFLPWELLAMAIVCARMGLHVRASNT